MKKTGIAAALGLMLAGCVSSGGQEHAQVRAAGEQATAACNADAKAGRFPTWAAYGRCLDNADALVFPTWGQNADLLRLFMAQRAAIFEQVDRRQITPAQASAQVAQANVAMRSEEQRRLNASRAVAAQEQAAMAASMPAPMPAPYRPMYCSRFGISVTCF